MLTIHNFYTNLTSMHIAYYTIDRFKQNSSADNRWLAFCSFGHWASILCKQESVLLVGQSSDLAGLVAMQAICRIQSHKLYPIIIANSLEDLQRLDYLFTDDSQVFLCSKNIELFKQILPIFGVFTYTIIDPKVFDFFTISVGITLKQSPCGFHDYELLDFSLEEFLITYSTLYHIHDEAISKLLSDFQLNICTLREYSSVFDIVHANREFSMIIYDETIDIPELVELKRAYPHTAVIPYPLKKNRLAGVLPDKPKNTRTESI